MSNASGKWRRGSEEVPAPPPGRDGGPGSPTTPTRPGAHIIRPMPPGDSGASFADVARRSVQGDLGDEARFEAPDDPDGGNRSLRTLPVSTLMVLAVAMLVLGVAAGVLWVNVFRTDAMDPETIVSPTGGSQEELSSPREAVSGYLRALADGRAEDALTYGPPQSAQHSTLLLEQSSLDAMPAASRPSNIRVLTEDPLATDVLVEYTLADELVSTTMRTERQDDDSYRLGRTTVIMQLEVVGSGRLPVLLNGVIIDPALSFAVLPGTYRPSTGLPFVDFHETAPLAIPSLAPTDTVVFPINAELTSAGRAGFETAARTSLAHCLASQEPAPSGCPNAVRNPKEVVPGSVTWQLQEPGSVWELFTPSLSPEDQTMATATLSMQMTATMDYTDGRARSSPTISVNAPLSATMKGDDPASISVVWGT